MPDDVLDCRESLDQTQKAVLTLRDLILSGEINPGDRLSEPMLVSVLGLSRTPIRAALMRLEQEGLTERIPTGGYAARIFTGADIADAIELRGVMEGMAMRLAAERGLCQEQIKTLTCILDRIDEQALPATGEVDLDTYSDLNDRFHSLLLDYCGSELLIRETKRISAYPFAAPSALNSTATQIVHEAQQHHRSIVDAIGRREGSRAEALGREHARIALRNLDRVMTNPALHKLLVNTGLFPDKRKPVKVR